MTPCEFSLSITTLANAIAGRLSDDDLALVAAAFSQLSNTLSTIAVHRSVCSGGQDSIVDELLSVD